MSSIQPVFIFGYTHSGTSLLQGILRRHPAVFSQLSESSFYQFPHIYMHKYPSLDADEAVYGMILFCANLITKGYRQLISLQSVQHDPDLLSSDELKAIQATLSKQPTHREIFPRTFDFLAERAGKRLRSEEHTSELQSH